MFKTMRLTVVSMVHLFHIVEIIPGVNVCVRTPPYIILLELMESFNGTFTLKPSPSLCFLKVFVESHCSDLVRPLLCLRGGVCNQWCRTRRWLFSRAVTTTTTPGRCDGRPVTTPKETTVVVVVLKG